VRYFVHRGSTHFKPHNAPTPHTHTQPPTPTPIPEPPSNRTTPPTCLLIAHPHLPPRRPKKKDIGQRGRQNVDVPRGRGNSLAGNTQRGRLIRGSGEKKRKAGSNALERGGSDPHYAVTGNRFRFARSQGGIRRLNTRSRTGTWL